MPAPTLHSPRLTLRPHVMEDLEQLCDLFETDRARHMGGPIPRKAAWRWIASEVGMWDLMGHGAWGIETKDGTFLGQIGIFQPPHFPEREIGWTLLDHAEGKGYATEAATLALHWAWDQGFETLVSYIAPDNDRSIALATRLGAARDDAAPLPAGETTADTVVYRHAPDTDGAPEAYA
ncbi:GNAT family N-acetyltransferase [Tropicibacter naphthalenivorans]|uniref:Acetyltransferase (GNAT) family protein n=1 Tax=Tropicibacter naphthalenivorans TaxID=441103 RepID=A0A0P1FZI8_9RHOB|nr:GNAT family N-acetyltransferase [Tropicibacter naphthalenivorans]CUH74819.1 Acetyltransferase (GNAT) family protein [Tropicibacter naphthalenivorans]SMC48797.1 Protein N-acetyltransferase, RimJ/RimL family [Tropicibacter naphthalenivorans]